MENKNEFFVPINEVAKQIGVPAHTLRYWEKQFANAIRPVTGAGGRRYYRHDTIEKINAIKSLLYDKGMTIAGVKKILHNGTFDAEIGETKNQQQTSVQKIEKTPVNAGEIDRAIEYLRNALTLLD